MITKCNKNFYIAEISLLGPEKYMVVKPLFTFDNVSIEEKTYLSTKYKVIVTPNKEKLFMMEGLTSKSHWLMRVYNTYKYMVIV